MNLKNKKKKTEKIMLVGFLLFVLGILLFSLVSGHENFTETKNLIDSNISCSKLNDEQLNEMGDYYMEQMHPGESHELMHEMMGGEDSEIIKLMHINMAKSIYCNENAGMGMMDMMMGRGGMMNSGMMTGNVMGSSGNMMPGMMGNYYGLNNWNIYSFLYLMLLIGLIILVILIIIKLLKDLTRNKKRK